MKILIYNTNPNIKEPRLEIDLAMTEFATVETSKGTFDLCELSTGELEVDSKSRGIVLRTRGSHSIVLHEAVRGE